MATIASLIVDIGADTSALLSGADKSQKVLDRLGGNMTKLGRGFATTLTPALLGAGGAAVAAAVTIDNAMTTIAGGTGAAGEALTALGDDFRAVLGQVPQSADVVATAIADMNTSTGATGEALQGLALGVLNASRALGETEVPALSFGRALTQFEIPAANGTAALDAMVVTAQDTGVGLGQLIDQTNTYGGVLKNAGFDIFETVGFFGQLQSAGIDVSRVMPGLNKAFRDWASEGLNARDMLEQTVGQMLEATSESEALNIATDKFGAEGAQRLTTAVRSGVLQLDKLTAGLIDSVGATAKAGDATKTFADKFAELKNQATLALEPIGVRLIDALEKMMPLITGVIGAVASMAELFADLPVPVQAVALGLSAVAAAAGPVLLVVGKLLPLLGGTGSLAALFAAVKVGAVAVAAALGTISAPVWVVIGAVTAMIAIWVKWGDDIKRIVGETFRAVADWFGPKFDAIVARIGERISSVTGFFRNMWQAVVGGSYVPDMVQQIGHEFAKLDHLMVDRVRRQTAETSALFADAVVPVTGSGAGAMAGPVTVIPTGNFGPSSGGQQGVRTAFSHANPFTLQTAAAATSSTVRVTVDARGALFDDAASQDRLADIIDDVLTRRLRASGVRLQTA